MSGFYVQESDSNQRKRKEHQGNAWTILRPNLIYSYGKNYLNMNKYLLILRTFLFHCFPFSLFGVECVSPT